MQEKCSKCNSEKLFVEIQGNRRGLYCGKCGKWQKWITKQELQILGKYEIEERAKEVLAEIVQKYSSYLQLTGGPAIMQGQIDIQPNIFNIPKVYEMPED